MSDDDYDDDCESGCPEGRIETCGAKGMREALEAADRLADLMWQEHKDHCAVTYALDEDHEANQCREPTCEAVRAYRAARATP